MDIEIKEYEDYVSCCTIFHTLMGLPMFTQEEWLEQFEEYYLEYYIMGEINRRSK